jgi:hypothetical protein
MNAFSGGLLVRPHQLQAGQTALVREVGEPDISVDLVGQHFLDERSLFRRQQ